MKFHVLGLEHLKFLLKRSPSDLDVLYLLTGGDSLALLDLQVSVYGGYLITKACYLRPSGKDVHGLGPVLTACDGTGSVYHITFQGDEPEAASCYLGKPYSSIKILHDGCPSEKIIHHSSVFGIECDDLRCQTLKAVCLLYCVFQVGSGALD